MATSIQPCSIRRILPARCEAIWVQLPARPGQAGTADINGEEYAVQSILDRGRRVGVRFTSPRGDVRDVDLRENPPRCDCPDWETRRQHTDGMCKHRMAIQQLDAEARAIRARAAEWSEVS